MPHNRVSLKVHKNPRQSLNQLHLVHLLRTAHDSCLWLRLCNVQNTALNRSDNILSYSPDNNHQSDEIYYITGKMGLPCDDQSNQDIKNIELQTDVGYQKRSKLFPLLASIGQTPNFHCHLPHHQDDNNGSVHDSITQFINKDIYLRQGGNVFAGLCLSVCLCVSKITQKVMDGSV